MRSAFFLADLRGTWIPLRHVWEHTIGSDHAPVALRADWQSQLRRCREELGVRRVRFHGLLSDDVGTLVRHDNELVYSFFNVDTIWDHLLSIGMQPFVELSFMPRAIASGRSTVFRYAANVTPPKNYRSWAELVHRLARHAIERYGESETKEWNFEVWNEPNLKSFWRGKQSDYFRLYAATARALKEANPDLRVGGPASAENEWLEDFLEFCDARHAPADFVSTHFYPTDPTKHVSPDSDEQLEAARRGILRESAAAARRRVRDRPLYYTEWNTSANDRDTLHDLPYAAAFIVKTVLEVSATVDAYAFWTFSDLFGERYFPSLPFHGGFGLLTLHGVAKPAYRAFQLLHGLGEELLVPVDGIHPTVDCWVTRKAARIDVVLTNHALPRHEIAQVRIHLRLTGAPNAHRATIMRIDESHANPRRAWRDMGSPELLSEAQLTALHDASTLTSEPMPMAFDSGALTLDLTLPPHGVAFLSVE